MPKHTGKYPASHSKDILSLSPDRYRCISYNVHSLPQSPHVHGRGILFPGWPAHVFPPHIVINQWIPPGYNNHFPMLRHTDHIRHHKPDTTSPFHRLYVPAANRLQSAPPIPEFPAANLHHPRNGTGAHSVCKKRVYQSASLSDPPLYNSGQYQASVPGIISQDNPV